ncbi:MAG: type I methionyl aminopeptidase [Patescibacteria group bacterium]|jgi:methionyl aminopeptidase
MDMRKTPDEIRLMREGGKILAQALHTVAKLAVPGADVGELDEQAIALLEKQGAKSAFKGYEGFPAGLCVSINSEVVHGIPVHGRVLKEGDIVGLDFGALYKGWYTDMALTVSVGKIGRKEKKLIEVTREALERGIRMVKPGNTIGDIGSTIQKYVEKKGFSVVRSLVGHGIGRHIHEDPQVPNFGAKGTGERLEAGMTIAIEPMVNAGEYPVRTLDDGWTIVTEDGSRSAHFEHTVAVTERGYEILTAL